MFLGRWKCQRWAEALTLHSYFIFYTCWLPMCWFFTDLWDLWDPSHPDDRFGCTLLSSSTRASHYPLESKILVLAGSAFTDVPACAKGKGTGSSWCPWAQHFHPQVVPTLPDHHNHWLPAEWGEIKPSLWHPCPCSAVSCTEAFPDCAI